MLTWIITIYLGICIVRIVMSFVGDSIGSGSILATFGRLSYSLTEPIFATVRRMLPNMGDIPIDLAPMITMVALGVLRQITSSIGI